MLSIVEVLGKEKPDLLKPILYLDFTAFKSRV